MGMETNSLCSLSLCVLKGLEVHLRLETQRHGGHREKWGLERTNNSRKETKTQRSWDEVLIILGFYLFVFWSVFPLRLSVLSAAGVRIGSEEHTGSKVLYCGSQLPSADRGYRC